MCRRCRSVDEKCFHPKVAKPISYIGKHVKVGNVASQTIKLTDARIREAILAATGLYINSGSWSGIPVYCRFTISLQEDEFEQALDCITNSRI